MPDLTLAIVALLMLLVAWTFRVHLPVSTVCTSIPLRGAHYIARVPTPPPQTACYDKRMGAVVARCVARQNTQHATRNT